MFSGLVIIWFLAGWPTRRSPFWVKATMEGVVRCPSEFWMTTGSPPSMTATHELVVPRSMPIILPIPGSFCYCSSVSELSPFCPEASVPPGGPASCGAGWLTFTLAGRRTRSWRR